MPKAKEITVSYSLGAKIQVVKFEYQGDFHSSMSRTYDISDLTTEDEVEQFQLEKIKEIREQLRPIAQKGVDGYMELRDRLEEE